MAMGGEQVEGSKRLVVGLRMTCRTGCVSQDHESWGNCARDARIQIDRHGLKYSGLEKAKDKRLAKYETARSNGLQPRSTTTAAIEAAYENGGV